MTLAAKVKHFIDIHHVSYRILKHKRTRNLESTVQLLGIEPNHVVQAILLKDPLGIALALLPLGYRVDLMLLFKQTNRLFGILSDKDANKFFNDCEPGSRPPFGRPYGIPLAIDKCLENLNPVYFEAGSHTAIIQMAHEDFQFLTIGEPYLSFAVPIESDPLEVLSPEEQVVRQEMKINMPALPSIACQILEIANKPSNEAISILSDLISKDAIINGHILLCAQRYLNKGQLQLEQKNLEGILQNSLQDVISNVIGFETVSHIAVGITAGRTFNVCVDGPLGAEAFWKHALYSAMLAKLLSERVAENIELDPNLCYLIGFFHNFGYLLMGHLFPPEFRLLNRWLSLRPEIPIEVLEKRLLGMGQAMTIVGNGHAQLGAWLMQYWEMPDPIITAIQYHHSFDYEGPYAPYVALLQLTNQLLRTLGIGDGHKEDTPNEKWLKQLGLSIEEIEKCLRIISSEMEFLDQMAIGLAN